MFNKQDSFKNLLFCFGTLPIPSQIRARAKNCVLSCHFYLFLSLSTWWKTLPSLPSFSTHTSRHSYLFHDKSSKLIDSIPSLQLINTGRNRKSDTRLTAHTRPQQTDRRYRIEQYVRRCVVAFTTSYFKCSVFSWILLQHCVLIN